MIVTDNLVGYWNSLRGFENNLSPNTNNAVISGATSSEDGVLFSGDDDRITIAIPSELGTAGNPYTVEILFTPHDVATTRQLIGTNTYTSIDEWGAWYQHYEGNTWDSEVGHWITHSFSNNTLVSLVSVYDPQENEVRYYINGVLVNISIVDNPIKWVYGSQVTLGYDQYGDPTFKGFIHAFRLYNKPLSAGEVLQNYNNGLEVGLLEEEVPKEVIVEFTNDGKLLLAGQIIEGKENIEFMPNGDLWVSEFIEGQTFEFKGNMLYLNEIIENVNLEDRTMPKVMPNVLHLNGPEYGVYNYTAATNSFSNQNRGVLGTDYHYDSQGFLDYIASRGWTIVKIPIRWERIQSTINGSLNATEIGYLRNFMDRCQSAGLKVIIDIHNYGIYYLHESGMGQRKVIGTTELPISAFADLWTRLANEFHNHPATFGYAIMAEPQDAGGLTRVVWENASQQAVNAIRQIDIRSEIHVSGFAWGTVTYWESSNSPTAWINDPTGGIIRYEGHHYFDSDTSGGYENTYAYEVNHASNNGHVKGSNKDALHTKVLSGLQGYINWLTRNDVLGIIGEVGYPTNDVDWDMLGQMYLSELKRLNIPVTAWAAGEWTRTYILSVYGGSYPNIVTSLAAQTWEGMI